FIIKGIVFIETCAGPRGREGGVVGRQTNLSAAKFPGDLDDFVEAAASKRPASKQKRLIWHEQTRRRALSFRDCGNEMGVDHLPEASHHGQLFPDDRIVLQTGLSEVVQD